MQRNLAEPPVAKSNLIVYNLFSSDKYDYDVQKLERELLCLRCMSQWVG